MSRKVILWLQYHLGIGCTDIFMAQAALRQPVRIVRLADSDNLLFFGNLSKPSQCQGQFVFSVPIVKRSDLGFNELQILILHF